MQRPEARQRTREEDTEDVKSQLSRKCHAPPGAKNDAGNGGRSAGEVTWWLKALYVKARVAEPKPPAFMTSWP